MYIPIVQRECDVFVECWNTHRIRSQEKLKIPTGIPDYLFSFPEQYGGEYKGYRIEKSQLKETAEVSKILDTHLDLVMEENLKRRCEAYLPYSRLS